MPETKSVQLSLHQIVVRELPPADLVRLASDLGCAYVCLFVQPVKAAVDYATVDDGNLAEVRSAMDSLGIGLLGATSFPVVAGVDLEAYLPGLERAAALGGRVASVRVLDPDEGRATEAFGRLAQMAGGFGLEACIEFTGFGDTDAFDRTVRIIRAAGAGKVSLDALHIVRTGASMESIRALDPGLIGYVQLCDGPLAATRELYAQEGGLDRGLPGDGEFPLKDLIEIAAGHPFSLEVPQESLLQAGVSAADRARRAVEGTRRLLATL